MERYINADEAILELAKVFMPNDYPKIVRAISSTRTADVRLDIKAHWVTQKIGNGETRYTCSECGVSYECDSREAWDFLFCPNCGAQTDDWLKGEKSGR